ncbi:MAG TPA: FtsK/SpoIIIE domain-containing protein, partial [Pirellulales bacterium]|nr:FtsK/SpoIIIE domain-containing protein [Pirellulales bacterium]
AEPFRFLVVADFPANFSEAAQRRLLSIAHSGARCGVHMLVMADTRTPPAAGIALGDLEQEATTLVWSQGRFVWQHEPFKSLELALDVPPPPTRVTEILHFAGQYAKDAGRVEVPFEVIAPPANELWTSSARGGIEVPLGRSGATRLQSLKLGAGTSQHVLVAGKTGSGKSTLLHALITNLALRYSPDEIELYLVDFKQGVEFKAYATHRLPHARVVAIESDREFGVSVLARLDAELKARADRFRALGVQDLAGFREADPGTPMPRIMVIVDEFQEFFVEDDKIAQDAGLLLDRLVRQGRAFGIHVLLGSQTLAGTYTLARSTIGQMAVRIALQCSETDAHLILSEDNSAARLLSRAGEAIYNDSNGLVEGNHPFQVVWLGDERREKYLEQVQAQAARAGAAPAQVVFEGNVAADLERNELLSAMLQSGRPVECPPAPRAWLGEAVAIKDPTSVAFPRQSGSNLLVVGQNEEAALGILTSALVGLSAQSPLTSEAGARFYIFDGSPAGSSQAASLATLCGLTADTTRLVAWRELPAAVGELAGEVERRQKAIDARFPPVFVLVYGLQKLRDLRRQEDDFGFSRLGQDRPP